jgi:hypothetical protein
VPYPKEYDVTQPRKKVSPGVAIAVLVAALVVIALILVLVLG